MGNSSPVQNLGNPIELRFTGAVYNNACMCNHPVLATVLSASGLLNCSSAISCKCVATTNLSPKDRKDLASVIWVKALGARDCIDLTK